MKKIITLLALVSILTGISLAEGAALPVEGTWGTTISDNGITFDMLMKLDNQTMTAQTLCNVGGYHLTASVTVPAAYDGSTITVLADGQNEVNENGQKCNVSVQTGRVNYIIVANNTLVLSRDGYPGQIILERR